MNQPESYGVYVLECKHPDSVYEAENRAWEHIGMEPRWLYAALNHHRIFYVGMHSDVKNRLKEHILGEFNAANFTKVFQPKELVETRWTTTFERAEKLEVGTAIEYRKEKPDWFVYQN